MHFRNSETIEELRETFSKTDTTERDRAEKLELWVVCGWDKKEVEQEWGAKTSG